MPRPGLRWINEAVLRGCVAGDQRSLEGAKEVLRAGERDDREFTMLIRQGCEAARVAIGRHARRRFQTLNVFTHLIARVDNSGFLGFDADRLAGELEMHPNVLYAVLADLEGEKIGVLTKVRHRGQLRGVQLTGKVFRQPKAKAPPKNRRNGTGRTRPRQAELPALQ